MALFPRNAWKWIALIAFLFAPGLIVAFLTHSAIWIAVAPEIFAILMLVLQWVEMERGERSLLQVLLEREESRPTVKKLASTQFWRR